MVKKYAFFWRRSWIYANCKNCPKLTACHPSQIGSMTPVKDRETKNSIALNISRTKLKPFSSVIWTRKQQFWAMWVCVCLNKAYMFTLRTISSAFTLIYYQYNKYHKIKRKYFCIEGFTDYFGKYSSDAELLSDCIFVVIHFIQSKTVTAVHDFNQRVLLNIIDTCARLFCIHLTCTVLCRFVYTDISLIFFVYCDNEGNV